jgi:hypothetical protein
MKRLVVLLLAVLALSGCSLAQTTPDEVGLRYSGGALFAEAEAFKKCYNPSESEHGDAGDKVYIYPAGQRTFKFSNDPGSDSPPISVTALGGITLGVSGTVTFTPNFQDCATLRDFHERIGRKYAAYLSAEDDTTTTKVEGAEGWTTMLLTYVKDPTERALDNDSLGYDPYKLTTDPATKAEWEQKALADIPKVMQQQSGGEFFKIDSVLLQAPQLPEQMVDGQIAKQTAQQAADAAVIAAEASKSCDQTCQTYQQSQVMNKAIADGKVQVLPIPYGSPVIANPSPTPR